MKVLDAAATSDQFATDLAAGLMTLTDVLSQPGAATASTSRSVTLGRDGGNDIVVDKPEVSRSHLQLRQSDDLEVRDVGSSNGTTVLRQAERLALTSMAWMKLQPGDIVVTLRDVPIFRVPS